MRDRRVVVIGAGITGVLVARELALRGWSVTVAEAAHIGAGSSSRTAAGIRQQFSTEATVRGMRHSVQWYKRFAEETENGTCPIIQNGYLFLSADGAQWAKARQRVQMQRNAGLTDVVALEREELVHRFPYVDPEVCIGGTFCPSDGFLLPDVVYQEGARRARTLGATILSSCGVVGAQSLNGRITGLVTEKGLLEADLFVDCTNAWSEELAVRLGAEVLPVEPLKRYLWFVKRDGEMTDAQFADMPLIVEPTGVYCRPENPRTLLMGWGHPAEPERGFAFADQDVIDPEFAHDAGIDGVPFEVWARLAEAVPPIGDFAGITSTACGYYGTTPDHNPFLGFDRKIPNLIRLVGFSGHGAMFGPFSAAVAAALAEEGRDVVAVSLDVGPVPLADFSIGRDFASSETLVI